MRDPSGEKAGEPAHPGSAVNGTAAAGADSERFRHLGKINIATKMQIAAARSAAPILGRVPRVSAFGGTSAVAGNAETPAAPGGSVPTEGKVTSPMKR